MPTGPGDVVPHCPPALISSSRNTTSSPSKCRTAPGMWCLTALQPLFLRRGTPRPASQIPGRPRGRGASLSASPCFFVEEHHVRPLKVTTRPGGVVLHCPPALISSSTSTTSATPKCRLSPGTWCLTSPCSFVEEHHVLRSQSAPPTSSRPVYATGFFKISIFLDKCVLKGNFFYGIISIRRYTI